MKKVEKKAKTFSLCAFGDYEVDYLCKLPKMFFSRYIKELKDNNIKVTYIGELERFPLETQQVIQDALMQTHDNTGLELVIAINYGSRREIVLAAEKYAKDVMDGKKGLSLSEDEFNEYMLLCLKDEKNVPKFLCFISGFWHGGIDSGWSFEEKNISQYLSCEDMHKKVQSLKGTEKFNALSDEQQQVAIAFSLWYETENKENYHSLSKKNVLELLPTWIKND